MRFMGRQLRTRLDSVKPDNRRENKRLEKQMERGYPTQVVEETDLRRSSRVSKAPDRLECNRD